MLQLFRPPFNTQERIYSMVSFLQKASLFKGILSGERPSKGPFYINLDVTHRCNLNCLGCPYHSLGSNLPSQSAQLVKDIPFDLVTRLCDELKRLKTKRILLIGEGEPLLHPHIFEIISKCKESGFHVAMYTNGTLLDSARIASILDSRLDILQVSLWASSPEIYEKNYPGTDPNNFNKVVEGLKNLNFIIKQRKNNLPSVLLRHPINKYNFQAIDALVELALSTDCRGIIFAPMRPYGGRFDSFELSASEEDVLCNSLNQLKKRIKSLPLKHNLEDILFKYQYGKRVWKIFPCYAGWTRSSIKTDGTVQPCNSCNLMMGDLHQSSFQEIWNGLPYRDFRRKTLTQEGLASLKESAECQFCYHIRIHASIYRLHKWLSPIKLLLKKKGFSLIP
jgi:radical SAM protein with 4Fe4S-binding SPASM domain